MKLIRIIFLPLIQNLMLTNLYWVEKQDLPVVIADVTLTAIVLVQIHATSVVGGLDTEISALIQTMLFIASLPNLWVLQLICLIEDSGNDWGFTILVASWFCINVMNDSFLWNKYLTMLWIWAELKLFEIILDVHITPYHKANCDNSFFFLWQFSRHTIWTPWSRPSFNAHTCISVNSPRFISNTKLARYHQQKFHAFSLVW